MIEIHISTLSHGMGVLLFLIFLAAATYFTIRYCKRRFCPRWYYPTPPPAYHARYTAAPPAAQICPVHHNQRPLAVQHHKRPQAQQALCPAPAPGVCPSRAAHSDCSDRLRDFDGEVQ